MNEANIIAPIIQPATQTIIIFAYAINNDDVPVHQTYFAFGRYTYSGECLSTHYANLSGVTALSGSRRASTFVPVDYKRNILSIVMRDSLGKSSFLVRFNEEEMDMSVWEGSRLYEHPEFTHTNGAMAWWKDTCYVALWDGEIEKRDMIALMDGKTDKHDMDALMGASDGRVYKPIVSESTDSGLLHDWDEIKAPVVMNENYVIRNAKDRFYILCFDDDDEGKWPKESGPFFDIGGLRVLKGMDT